MNCSKFENHFLRVSSSHCGSKSGNLLRSISCHELAVAAGDDGGGVAGVGLIVKRLAWRDERKPILSEREPYGDYSDSRSFQNQTSSQPNAIKSYFDGPMFQEWLSLARKHRSTQETSG
jgi:hypothetical protein